MSATRWFTFELYCGSRLVGQSRSFEVQGHTAHADARRAAELAWLETGALRGTAFERIPGTEHLEPNRYVLREQSTPPKASR